MDDKYSSNQDSLLAYQSYLCFYLKKYPYWARGHLALAEVAINLSNPELAHASVMAYQTLKDRTLESLMLLGNSYLMVKDSKKARACFSEVFAKQPMYKQAREDLLACDLLDGDWEGVLNLLSGLSEVELSAHEKVALEWANGKA